MGPTYPVLSRRDVIALEMFRILFNAENERFLKEGGPRNDISHLAWMNAKAVEVADDLIEELDKQKEQPK